VEDERITTIVIALALMFGAGWLVGLGVFRSAVSTAIENVVLLTIDEVPPSMVTGPGRRQLTAP